METKIEKYKMNFATKTLTITKAFAEEALNPESAEAQIIANCRAACPDLRIAYRTHKSSKTSNPAKGMTYDRITVIINYRNISIRWNLAIRCKILCVHSGGNIRFANIF